MHDYPLTTRADLSNEGLGSQDRFIEDTARTHTRSYPGYSIAGILDNVFTAFDNSAVFNTPASSFPLRAIAARTTEQKRSKMRTTKMQLLFYFHSAKKQLCSDFPATCERVVAMRLLFEKSALMVYLKEV